MARVCCGEDRRVDAASRMSIPLNPLMGFPGIASGKGWERMIRLWLATAAIGGLALDAGASIASEAQWWHPVAPAVRIDVTEGAVQAPTLVLVYGAGDPFQHESLSGAITSCRTLAGTCATAPADWEFGLSGTRRQSLQVRWLTEDGEPAVAGVVWEGAGVPRQVELRCDLASRNPRAACSMVRVGS
jgi:hypothetical protein